MARPTSFCALIFCRSSSYILSEYLKGHDRNVARRASDYTREHGVFTFTSVTVYEIVFGLEVKNATSQLQKVLAWLSQNEQIMPIASHYLDAARIKAVARKQGSIVELPDSLIAAVSMRHSLPLVTGNTDDFRAIQNTGIALRTQNWRNPN